MKIFLYYKDTVIAKIHFLANLRWTTINIFPLSKEILDRKNLPLEFNEKFDEKLFRIEIFSFDIMK